MPLDHHYIDTKCVIFLFWIFVPFSIGKYCVRDEQYGFAWKLSKDAAIFFWVHNTIGSIFLSFFCKEREMITHIDLRTCISPSLSKLLRNIWNMGSVPFGLSNNILYRIKVCWTLIVSVTTCKLCSTFVCKSQHFLTGNQSFLFALRGTSTVFIWLIVGCLFLVSDGC